MEDIILASHVAFVGETDIHGPAHSVADFLKERIQPFIFIKHSTKGDHPSLIEFHQSAGMKRIQFGSHRNRSPLFQFLWELWISLKFIRGQYKQKNDTISLFIGIDPGNAFIGFLAKRFGWVKKIIFYTPDYTTQRFKNKVFNWLYHRIDQYVVRRADRAWNVSLPILKVRSSMGRAKDSNILVPNAPFFDRVKRLNFNEIRRYDLVVVGNVTKSVEYILPVQVIARLKSKYPDIRLLIIGEGSYFDELKGEVKKLQLENSILFLGKKSHNEVMEIISTSAIGLALYTGEYKTNFFGDSKKAREYLAAGLPTIITNVPANAEEIEEARAGFVINLDSNELTESIDKLLGDDKLYLEMRQNALRLAKKNDLMLILERELGPFLEY